MSRTPGKKVRLIVRAWVVVCLSWLLAACIQTTVFSYPHPHDLRRSLSVALSHDRGDTFRVIIDHELILQQKLNFDRQVPSSWAFASGLFEGESVILSCTRVYEERTITNCDFSIGAGPHMPIKIP